MQQQQQHTPRPIQQQLALKMLRSYPSNVTGAAIQSTPATVMNTAQVAVAHRASPGTAEQQGTEECTDASSHAELPALDAQTQQRKRNTDADSNGYAGSKRRRGDSSNSSSSRSAINEESRTHRNRLPVVQLPGGIWHVDGMVSTACV
jgi:hypothetical protein